jgi:hypothetical protein
VIAAGGQFYTSGTFWAGASVAAVLLSTVAIVWVTLRVGSLKRRLLYSMPVVTPLLNERPGMPRDVEVRRAGQLLTFPQVVNIELVSRGRRDIPRDAFDGGEPLCLDVGVPIVECLQVKISPSDRPEPLCKVDSSKLLVGPSLIGRRQTMVFSLLVDGPSPKLSRPPQSLIDVDLRPRDTGSESLARRYVLLLALVVIIAAVPVIVVLTHNRSWIIIIAVMAFIIGVPTLLGRILDR